MKIKPRLCACVSAYSRLSILHMMRKGHTAGHSSHNLPLELSPDIFWSRLRLDGSQAELERIRESVRGRTCTLQQAHSHLPRATVAPAQDMSVLGHAARMPCHDSIRSPSRGAERVHRFHTNTFVDAVIPRHHAIPIGLSRSTAGVADICRSARAALLPSAHPSVSLSAPLLPAPPFHFASSLMALRLQAP